METGDIRIHLLRPEGPLVVSASHLNWWPSTPPHRLWVLVCMSHSKPLSLGGDGALFIDERKSEECSVLSLPGMLGLLLVSRGGGPADG